jgi:hypothetical protein
MSDANFLNSVNFLNSPKDLITILIVFIVGCYLIFKSSNYFNSTITRALLLYIWHSVFCFAYIFATTIIGGDSIWYYTSSLNVLREFSVGTTAVQYLTAIFTVGFGLTYISTFLVFNIIGSYGLLAFDATLRHINKNKSGFVKSLSLFIILLPSLSFWSSAIGKDSIHFMATTFLLWSCIDFNKRKKMFLFSLGLIFLVRPHISGIAIIAFTLSIIFIKTYSPSMKKIYFIISLISLIFILPFILEYVGLGRSISIDTIISYIKSRQNVNMGGGSSIDIRQMNLPYQLFTYLFRPLPYEAHSVFAFLSSIDNVLILTVFTLSFLSIISLKGQKFNLNHPTENRLFLLIFGMAMLIILSLTTANLGIAVRQKWMVLPILLYFAFLFMRVRWSNKPKFKKV